MIATVDCYCTVMRYTVRPRQLLSMQTPDGVRLDADVYYPDSAESFPVLLMRQPYGRAIASTVVYAHPIWYAAHGYIVVIQDVRGRGSSEGDFSLFVNEQRDGAATVDWAASLPQSTGAVGMYGFSYQGMTQLYAAIDRPAALKTICPSMIAYNCYADWAYSGGAFCYQLNLGWAMQLAAETVRRQGNQTAYQTLYTAARQLPLPDPVCPRSDLLDQLAPDSHYHDWLKFPVPDEAQSYWNRLSPAYSLIGAEVDLPMLHIGGWFDTHLSGTLRFYQEMARRSRHPQRLVVGPWAHLPWARKTGAIDYGPTASSPVDQLQIRWFDQILKGLDTGLQTEPPVWLFEMGGNRWHKFDSFPTANPQPFHLVSETGLAAMSDQTGQLQSGAAADSVADVLVHDPWRPVPALGGHTTMPAGAFERSAIDGRSDVLTYTSAVLTTDLHLAGELWAEIDCTADSVSFDLCAVLSEVKPDGSVYNFSQGYRRLNSPFPDLPYRITLQPTCICIPQGSAIRLSLSASCFPAHPVNPGTGTLPAETRLIDARVITITVNGASSRVWLPVVEA